MKFGKRNIYIIALCIIAILLFIVISYRIKRSCEKFENNNQIKIVINSYKDNTIALNKLLNSLKKCKEYVKSKIYVFIGGYYDNSEYTSKEENNITYIYCNHNSIDFTGLLGILEYLPKQTDYYFYMHDTCVVGPKFLKNINAIDLSNVSSMSLKTFPSMNIGVYSNDTIHKYKNDLLTYKNTDHTKTQDFKIKGQKNEDLIFKKDDTNKLINDKDQLVSVSDPYDYYGTGVLRVVEYYDLDLYKIKANWKEKKEYELKL